MCMQAQAAAVIVQPFLSYHQAMRNYGVRTILNSTIPSFMTEVA